jgi:hypothetical protein
MRILLFVLLMAFVSCGEESSPEGRMTIRLNALQQEVDSLENQNRAILDSLGAIREELRSMRNDRQ